MRHVALAALAACASASPAAWAQGAATLPAITVTGRGAPSADVAGWGDVSWVDAPFQASVVSLDQFRSRNVQRIADVARIDPSVSDAYNSTGYWDSLTVRGFVIDNRFNFRRDGLPINAETSIPLDNKDRIEVLKGTSGLQSGTSAPGGLVNVIVKRPLADPLRYAQVRWSERDSVLVGMDLSQRFGDEQEYGLRLNAAHEHLNPKLRSARGSRHVIAAAGDWRVDSRTTIEAEAELSHRSQPSQPAFSMLGNNVPAPTDPRINLNNQPWSQPVVMDGNTASLRLTHRLNTQWKLSAHAMTQRLRTDDRLAFPFGCSAEGNYDRYCSDGTFDLYDYRSENERRRSDAVELAAHGDVRLGNMRHRVSTGVLRHEVRNRFQDQAFNLSLRYPGEVLPTGIGNVNGSLLAYPDATLTAPNTNRNERSTELFVRDAVSLTERLTAWGGLRHTRLNRSSVQTDGTEATGYARDVTTPWLAASYRVGDARTVYASWGQGIESEVVPNRPEFINAGQALPARKSEQVELGYKTVGKQLSWGLAWFQIVQPTWETFNAGGGSEELREDGDKRHRGLEATMAWRSGPWSLQGGLQALHARRVGSGIAGYNEQRPTNVPALSMKLYGARSVRQVPGLELQAAVLAESDRMVLPDNSAHIPGYGRLDLATVYEQRKDNGTLTWRLGVDNVFDRQAWRESPYQYGHAYLYPLAPRTVRISLEASL
jgi:iron complex outermembrane receptor protein